jgi:hypothetical protein
MDKHVLSRLKILSVMSLSQINVEALNNIVAGLSLLQVLRLLIIGSVLIDWMKLDGWKDKIPFYLIKCPKHGYQLSYPSGYYRSLVCPKCIYENTTI